MMTQYGVERTPVFQCLHPFERMQQLVWLSPFVQQAPVGRYLRVQADSGLTLCEAGMASVFQHFLPVERKKWIMWVPFLRQQPVGKLLNELV